MLNQIFSCKKKKDDQKTHPKDRARDRYQREETSEVDDIITTFDCIMDTNCKDLCDESEASLNLKKRTLESQKYLFSEKKQQGCKGLPPIRAQSLPPITLGSSCLTTSNWAPSGLFPGTNPHHFAHRSQKSRSEHDLFDSRTCNRPLLDNPWSREAKHILAHKAWAVPSSDKTVGGFLPENSSHMIPGCSPHLPHLQTPPSGHTFQLSTLDRPKFKEITIARNNLAPIPDHCAQKPTSRIYRMLALLFPVGPLPPGPATMGVKKSKSLPLNSLRTGMLPQTFASKSQMSGLSQSHSLYSFLPGLSGESLRTSRVLPAIPSQKGHVRTEEDVQEMPGKLDNSQ